MAEPVEVSVLFFAKSREIAGLNETQLQIPQNLQAKNILRTIISHFPGLSAIEDNVILSLNEEYLNLQAEEAVALRPGDQLASDRMDFVDVVEEQISVEDVSARVSSPSCGATAVFIGTTRDTFDGKQVVRLEYEAYSSMAKRKMLEVCQLMHQRWPDIHAVAMVHRIGVVPVKEASIVIAASSPHRKEALEAVHFGIDTLKATVPIWKKEVYDDDSASWKQNKECAWREDKNPPEKPDNQQQ